MGDALRSLGQAVVLALGAGRQLALEFGKSAKEERCTSPASPFELATVSESPCAPSCWALRLEGSGWALLFDEDRPRIRAWGASASVGHVAVIHDNSSGVGVDAERMLKWEIALVS